MEDSPGNDRRRFLKTIGTGIVAVGTSTLLGKDWVAVAHAVESTLSAEGFPKVPGMTPEITPNDQFYQVSISWLGNPNLDVTQWRLTVGGLVENPSTLTYENLQILPAVEEYATLKCIGDPVDGKAMGNALWKGVRLRDLIDHAGGAKPGATEIILRAADSYSDSFPLKKALEKGTILAYRMNGVPLPKGHGYPARMIVPGIYGMKNVKWLTGLELADYDYKGYWERRGWSDVARYRTISRIDLPKVTLASGKPAFIAGVAFAGDRGIRKVEVSLDNGSIWQKALVKPALSPYSWVLWAYPWADPKPGNYMVTARATDGTGALQESKSAPSFPRGAAGLDRIDVTVRGS
jgi:DMSO/TMAO reductase YedYZ molybdopterin-dependent catalytic subunit